MVFTTSQEETKRRQVVALMRGTGKDDAADEFEAMSPHEYAEHRGAESIRQRLTARMSS